MTKKQHTETTTATTTEYQAVSLKSHTASKTIGKPKSNKPWK